MPVILWEAVLSDQYVSAKRTERHLCGGLGCGSEAASLLSMLHTPVGHSCFTNDPVTKQQHVRSI